MLLLGAHVSISGGVHTAIARASAFDMTACQIFTKNANQWAAKPLMPDVVDSFRTQWEESNIQQIVSHDSYLINIASSDLEGREKSRQALKIELDRCDILGIPYLVSHPGAHRGEGVETGIAFVVESVNRIHEEMPDSKAMLLLETTAGQGTTLGCMFEEIAAMIDGIDDKTRVGVCFDTCHVFAAGYDLRERDLYEQTMRTFGEIIGLDQIKVFHLNDSKKAFGSHVDRHAHIGEGDMGLEPFRFLLNDPRFDGLPGVLETPKGDDAAEDRMNLDTLISLYEPVA